jgi:hypothetical protein
VVEVGGRVERLADKGVADRRSGIRIQMGAVGTRQRRRLSGGRPEDADLSRATERIRGHLPLPQEEGVVVPPSRHPYVIVTPSKR